MKNKKKKGSKKTTLTWDTIVDQIKAQGINLEDLIAADGEEVQCKVILVDPNLGESVQEMSLLPRDVTVMIRTDDKTSKALDSWIQTGFFKSRSEAAALFLREGLKVRGSELEQLKDAIKQVEIAKSKLHSKARKILEGK